MKLKNGLLWLSLICAMPSTLAQEKPAQKIKLFIDCSNVWCDQTYIRSEINIIDFLLDRVSADVHMLITSQSLGNGGDRYQLIFYGQKRFAGMRDTLRFNMPPLATEVEIREKMLTNIKIGLVPYIAKTDQVSYLKFDLKKNEDDEEKLEDTTDAWNYWVFRLGANGNINTDQNYLNTNFNGNFSANRTTEQTRIDFRISTGKNRSVFKYENEDGEEESFTVLNTNYNINHTLVKSISDHWSYGYYFFLRNSTFSNIQNSFRYIPAIEYNIFPYKDVNNKYFAIGYGLDLRHNNYYEETIYNRMNENLIGHSARIVTSFNQKWGTLSSSVYYDAFFHDLKQMSLEINIQADVRLTGNLSFWAFAFGGLTRNQVFIPKGGTSVEDVLSRRRQLASGYNFGTFFGISYRFGSMLNNFVNPRFTDNF
jgi:hypothetical protein